MGDTDPKPPAIADASIRAVLAAVMAAAIVGTVMTLVGLPGLRPLPWSQALALFAYAAFSCLVVNDALKVLMIQRSSGTST